MKGTNIKECSNQGSVVEHVPQGDIDKTVEEYDKIDVAS